MADVCVWILDNSKSQVNLFRRKTERETRILLPLKVSNVGKIIVTYYSIVDKNEQKDSASCKL